MSQTRRHAAALLGVAMLLAAACGGSGDAAQQAAAGGVQTDESGQVVEDHTPFAMASGAAQSEPQPTGGSDDGDGGALGVESVAPTQALNVPETVDIQNADLMVTLPDGAGAGALETVRSVEGVDHAAQIALFPATVRSGEASKEIDVAAVEPEEFRPLTPDVTANVPGVWQRLLEGDVAIRHDIAFDLEKQVQQQDLLGKELQLEANGQSAPVRLGAFASNGAPPIAGLLVPVAVAEQFGVTAPNRIVASLADGATADDVRQRIVDALGGGEVEIRAAPERQQATLQGSVSQLEAFGYTSLGDGMIRIDPSWVQEYIRDVTFPHLGSTQCHKTAIPQVMAALQEIEARGLQGELNPSGFAGCWVPRHILWDPSKPLSKHAWGIALDINAPSNPYGATPRIDRRIVDIFKKWGFEWGGDWSTPDGMHFQLSQILDVPG